MGLGLFVAVKRHRQAQHHVDFWGIWDVLQHMQGRHIMLPGSVVQPPAAACPRDPWLRGWHVHWCLYMLDCMHYGPYVAATRPCLLLVSCVVLQQLDSILGLRFS